MPRRSLTVIGNGSYTTSY